MGLKGDSNGEAEKLVGRWEERQGWCTGSEMNGPSLNVVTNESLSVRPSFNALFIRKNDLECSGGSLRALESSQGQPGCQGTQDVLNTMLLQTCFLRVS